MAFVISAINPIYSMNSVDDENDSSSYSSLKKQKSDSEDDSDKESDARDEETTRLVRAETWGPTAEKLFTTAIHNQRPLDPLGYEKDLRMLVEVAKTGVMHPATRSTLATVLALFEDKDAKDAASSLNYIVALDSSLPLDDRENALEDLEDINLPEYTNLAYEARTTLAKDKSFPFQNRYKFAEDFLYLYNIKDLKHAINIFKEILLDHNYEVEVYSEILDGLRSVYSTDWPDLYKYAQKRVYKILGCSKAFDITYRFYWLGQVVVTGGKGYISTDEHESNIETEVFSTIKHRVSEDRFKDLLRSNLDYLSDDKLQGSFLIIAEFYNTPDSELPKLKGNLVSLLNLIGVNFCKEYEEAKKRIAGKYNIEFFESIKTYKPAKSIWNSMIEDAGKDEHIMHELKEYLKTYLPNIEIALNTPLN